VTNTDENVKKEIAEIDARRQAVGIEKSTANEDKQAKIVAAIARAKAQKAATEAAKQANTKKD
jgi:electron transport complex protein RnfC